MGLFKSKSEDQWKINYIKEFNEMRDNYEDKLKMKHILPYVITGLIIAWFIYLIYDLYAKFQESMILGLIQLTFIIVLLAIIMFKNKK